MIRHPSDRKPRIQSAQTRLLVAALILTPCFAYAKEANVASSHGSTSWAETWQDGGGNRSNNGKDRDFAAPGSFLHGVSQARSSWSSDDRDASESHSTVPIPAAFSDAGYGQKEASVGLPVPVAAVPEPQTYALLLAGLGAMVLVIRRQKRRE